MDVGWLGIGTQSIYPALCLRMEFVAMDYYLSGV